MLLFTIKRLIIISFFQLLLVPLTAYAESQREYSGVAGFIKQNKYPDITTFEWEAMVFVQCGAMFTGFASVETVEDKKSQYQFVSESFIGKASWAYAGYTNESPSSNELAFIQAWIEERHTAFAQFYFLDIQQKISKGEDHLENYLDDVTACTKFNGKYP